MKNFWNMTDEELEIIASDDEHPKQIEAEDELSLRYTIKNDPRVAQAMGEL